MHELLDEYELDGRCAGSRCRPTRRKVGELYRFVADQRGAFVQPALFEAFGLTVIESMSTGLPTFATRFGGPLEIIEDGVSGFHIDPNQGAETAQKLLEFFRACERDPATWDAISDAPSNASQSGTTGTSTRRPSSSCPASTVSGATSLPSSATKPAAT